VKGEGAFYIWTAEEIRELVQRPEAEWFSFRYGAADGGNVAHDPHQEFAGRNILYQAMTLEETAQHFARPLEEVREGLERASRILLEARARRVRPHLDDKILTAWNGLMISAFALGGAVLEEPRYAAAARRAAAFLIERMFDPATGVLLRRYRQGDAAIPGFLDDYALLAQALLDLYERQFDRRHLELALRLTEEQRKRFEDANHGGFFSSAEGDASLVVRMKEDYDGAEPSGNSVAAMNLLRLADFTNRSDLREAAHRTIAAFMPRLLAAPVGLPQMLCACERMLAGGRQIVLVGEPDAPATQALLHRIHARFLPNAAVLVLDSPEARAFFAAGAPEIAAMQTLDSQPAAYVCRDFACQLPVGTAGELEKLL